jgi:exonuclease SbcD
MKFLHTSDWHLGRSLYGRKRYEEFSAFLDWLSDTIQEKEVDVLLIAGDVFDTSTPSNKAQELYYRFLCRVSASCCQHIVVIGGNHDSPSFLNAPKELLRALNVFVVGAMTENPEDEVIVLQDRNQAPQAIVCAVPYLRDKDIRTVEPGETIDDKNAKLIEGVKVHYEKVCSIAESKKADLEKAGHEKVPIVAMGHLFTAGGKTVEGDGVRELYVGSLAHVEQDVFPSSIDYLALGHLHVPQVVGGAAHIRYSGSPIPMGYGEAKQDKKVILIEFNTNTPKIHEIQVPCFQELVRIVGTLDDIHAKVEQLKDDESQAWLEIEYTGRDIVGNLREILDEALTGSAMEIRRVKNKRVMERLINSIEDDETLDDLDVNDVFTRCLDAFEVPEEDRIELTTSHAEIIQSLNEEDVNVD